MTTAGIPWPHVGTLVAVAAVAACASSSAGKETGAAQTAGGVPARGKAIACMEADGWSVCSAGQCAMTALASAPASGDEERCGRVETRCRGMGAFCRKYIGGMNQAGRERFSRCLVDHCGTGLRFCLWDPMVTPCDEHASEARPTP